ncbi:hypothetical protein D3C86_1951100 [compost metagenome]
MVAATAIGPVLFIDDIVENAARRIDDSRILECPLQHDDARPGRKGFADFSQHRPASFAGLSRLQHICAVINQNILLDGRRMRIVGKRCRALHLSAKILKIAGSFRQPDPVSSLF